jgi:hypothetical protein
VVELKRWFSMKTIAAMLETPINLPHSSRSQAAARGRDRPLTGGQDRPSVRGLDVVEQLSNRQREHRPSELCAAIDERTGDRVVRRFDQPTRRNAVRNRRWP